MINTDIPELTKNMPMRISLKALTLTVYFRKWVGILALVQVSLRIFSKIWALIFSGRSSHGSGRRRGRDLQISVDVSLEEAANGAEKTITVPRYETCANCSGSGAKPGTKKTTCPQCKGSGRTVVSAGYFQLAQTCSRCGGEGVTIQTPCPECGGEGKTRVTRKIKVKIPAGVDTGSSLRVRGEGEGGGLTGEIYT